MDALTKGLGSVFVCLLLIPALCSGDQTLSSELVTEYRKALSELQAETKDNTGIREIGLLHYYIGNEAHDRDSINKAIDILERVLDKAPDDAEGMAYLGSAYAIKARDFPMKWIANITPVGFIRIYYVKKGLNLMNAAVERDKIHPVIRLIRGLTCANLPSPFMQTENGFEDLKLFLSWMENPSLNEKYSGIVEDKGFIADAYYRIGEVYLEKGDKAMAESLFKAAASINLDSPIGKAAMRRLNG